MAGERVIDDDQNSGRAGSTLWLTGLSAAGKTTVARALERRLAELGRASVLLDGDILHEGLSSDIGISPADRSEQARRAAHVAALIAGAGHVAIVSLISPYAEDRGRAREIHDAAGLGFHEIWIDTPLHVCEERDPKRIYARARAGEIRGVTGIDAPYEPPSDPVVRICGSEGSPEDAAAEILLATQMARHRGGHGRPAVSSSHQRSIAASRPNS
jgi:bifunctional enzyme CysN/CysC